MMKHAWLFASLFFFISSECQSQVTLGYPFGCSILVAHKFPKHWEASNSKSDSVMTTHEREFFHTSAWYEQMSRAKTFSPPVIEKTEYIKIGEGTSCTCTNSLASDSCRYKLANIGKYQCYYVSDDIYGNSEFEKSCPNNTCLIYGNLVLYDPATRTAKTLLIYYEGGSGQSSGTPFRYFYITKEKSIELYEGMCNDDGCDMFNKYSIHVLEDGEINIKENGN